jgi:Txe/YoeB family toxin of Txe-Axe toxin-antitoxin module
MSNEQNKTNVKIVNARLSFPAIFRPKKGPEENSKEAFSATFILDKKTNASSIKAIKDMIAQIVRDDFKGKTPPKICLRDGAEKELDGYGEDVMFISARCDRRPQVVNRDMSPLVEDDGKPYAGCYVNATVRLWAQDNKFGKRINAQLRAVQFVKDGAPFGEGTVDVSKEFEALPDEDEGAI